MIKLLTKRDENTLIDLFDYLKNNRDRDFYLTENNKRYYINSYGLLKKLLKNTTQIYASDNNGVIEGIILIWKAFGKGVSRNYIKLNAKNKKIADDLLTVLLWNYGGELYIKFKENSPNVKLFLNHNFEEFYVRDSNVLLRRRKDMKVIQKIKFSRMNKEVLD